MDTNSKNNESASRQNNAQMLLGETRRIIRLRQLSPNTEKQYLRWVRRYIRLHKRRHPRVLGSTGVEKFLSHLADERRVARSTQNQALNTLVFPYRNVLQIDLSEMNNIALAKFRKNVPDVLTPD
jgi:hypothetical protein